MAENSTPDTMLAALGLALPQLPSPGGNYVSAKRVGGAVGVSALPRNALVEIQITVRVTE